MDFHGKIAKFCQNFSRIVNNNEVVYLVQPCQGTSVGMGRTTCSNFFCDCVFDCVQMVRTKRPAQRDKGKGKVGESSSVRGAESPSQRQRQERGPKPRWGGGLLCDLDPDWQPELFKEKMNRLSAKHEGFICERVITQEDFEAFGIPQHFRRLG